MNSGVILKTLESQLESMSIQCAAFSSNGKQAISGGGYTKDLSFWTRLRGKQSEENWILSYWDLVSGKQIGHAEGQDDFIISAVYSPVDNKAISGGIKGDILLWDLGKMKVLKTFVGHSSGMRRNCLVWSQDGKTFLSGNWDGSIRLWSIQTGKEVAHLQAGYGRVMSLALSPDGKYALSSYLSGPNQPVILWDLENQREINRFGIPGNPWFTNQQLHVASVAFSADGESALFGFVFGTVIWWDLNEWQQIAMNRLHEDELTFVAFSADGKSSISVGWDTDKHTENAKVKFWQLPILNKQNQKEHTLK
jgi:WD40 repeat protein